MTNTPFTPEDLGQLMDDFERLGLENLGSTTFGVLYEGVRLGMLSLSPAQQTAVAQAAVHTGYLGDRQASLQGAAEMPKEYSRNVKDLLYLSQAKREDFTDQELFAEAANIFAVLTVQKQRLVSREERQRATREQMSTMDTKWKTAGWVAAVATITLATSGMAEAAGMPGWAGPSWAATMALLVTQLAQFRMYKKGDMKALGLLEHAREAEMEAEQAWKRDSTLIVDGWATDRLEEENARETGRRIHLAVSRSRAASLDSPAQQPPRSVSRS